MPTNSTTQATTCPAQGLRLLISNLRTDQFELIDGLVPPHVELHLRQSIDVLDSFLQLLCFDANEDSATRPGSPDTRDQTGELARSFNLRREESQRPGCATL